MVKRFSSQFSLSKSRRIFWQAKFPKRKHCLRCNSRHISVISDGRLLCRKCKYLFSVTTDTYLARSQLSLDVWYELLWWFVYGFTANKTAEETELSQRLVHRCFSTIPKAITDYEEAEMEKFFGEIEVDETYIGPKFRNRGRKKREYYRKINAVKRGRGLKTYSNQYSGFIRETAKYMCNLSKILGEKRCKILSGVKLIWKAMFILILGNPTKD